MKNWIFKRIFTSLLYIMVIFNVEVVISLSRNEFIQLHYKEIKLGCLVLTVPEVKEEE